MSRSRTGVVLFSWTVWSLLNRTLIMWLKIIIKDAKWRGEWFSVTVKCVGDVRRQTNWWVIVCTRRPSTLSHPGRQSPSATRSTNSTSKLSNRTNESFLTEFSQPVIVACWLLIRTDPLTIWPLNWITGYSYDGLPSILGFLGLSFVDLGWSTRQTDRRTELQTDTGRHFIMLLLWRSGHSNKCVMIIMHVYMLIK